jgi:iron(III) transport system substrate-binding protein
VNWTQYGIPAKFAPEKYAVICAHSIFCIVHNTQKLTAAEYPKSWDDLTNPRWKGKIGSPVFSHPYAGLVPVWGEARVDAFMEKFMQNNPVLTPSSYTLAQQVGSGELMVTVGLNWTARPVIKAGGPVKIVFPDPLPINTNYSMLPKLAKNVNSAMLYACWLTTDEGARAYEAATGRGNIFRDTEISKVSLPTWSEFPIKDVPKFAALIEKYNKVLRKG